MDIKTNTFVSSIQLVLDYLSQGIWNGTDVFWSINKLSSDDESKIERVLTPEIITDNYQLWGEIALPNYDDHSWGHGLLSIDNRLNEVRLIASTNNHKVTFVISQNGNVRYIADTHVGDPTCGFWKGTLPPSFKVT